MKLHTKSARMGAFFYTCTFGFFVLEQFTVVTPHRTVS